VERQEAEAGDERQRDQVEARIAPAARRHAHRIAEAERDHGRSEDEPEVRRVALPANVEPHREREQEQQAERHEARRNGERDPPAVVPLRHQPASQGRRRGHHAGTARR
jgi:hypothetical protein